MVLEADCVGIGFSWATTNRAQAYWASGPNT
jgi:hypothetical protein